MASAMDVANFLIHLRDQDEQNSQYFSLSNLKLQKLLYYCQGAHYKWDNERLIEDELFEAWEYGPVIREVYFEFKNFGQNDIHSTKLFGPLNENEKETIEAVWNQLKNMSAFQLVERTHSEAPWENAKVQSKFFIEDQEIKDYFQEIKEVNS